MTSEQPASTSTSGAATTGQGGPLGAEGLYGQGARALQDHFDSRRLADRLVEVTLHHELTDDDIALVAEQSTVWLATVDADGWPDVSYKGGDQGFVRVAGRTQLQIPIFDGNGMFRTLGNIEDTGRIGVLFVDTNRPWRMRVHGTATVSTDPGELAHHHGAQALVVVSIGRIFPNCGRYIHTGGEISRYVPREGAETPLPSWKKLPMLRDALPAVDAERVEAEARAEAGDTDTATPAPGPEASS